MVKAKRREKHVGDRENRKRRRKKEKKKLSKEEEDDKRKKKSEDDDDTGLIDWRGEPLTLKSMQLKMMVKSLLLGLRQFLPHHSFDSSFSPFSM